MIIDTHQHLGRSMFSGVETTESKLLSAMAAQGVDMALVMPQPTRDDIRVCHDRIAAAVASHPTRLRGVASIDPRLSPTDYREEAKRCIVELKFIALKLHPLGHNIAPDHPDADHVFRTASELGVPVIIHTGKGTPWSLPSLCIPPALRYPDVSIVLAHAGWGVYSAEAVVAAEVCENIYLEPSWCPTYVTASMIRRFGAIRVLFGSDHISNLPVELAKYRAIGLTEEELGQVFETTPLTVFQLD